MPELRTQEIVQAVGVVFVIMTVGGLVRRLNWLSEEADQSLLRIIVRLLVPCLVFDVILGNANLRDLQNVWPPPLVGASTVLIGFLLAHCAAGLYATLTRRFAARCSRGTEGADGANLADPVQRRTFAFCTGLHNYGYIPIPLIALLFPKDGTMGVLFVHNLGVEIILWTVGILVLAGGLRGKWWDSLLSPPFLSICLALVLNLGGLDVYVPEMASKTIHLLGQCAIPIALVLVGAITADHLSSARTGPRIGVIVLACALRNFVLPAIVLLMAWLLPVPKLLKQVLIVEAAMPGATFAIVLTKHYQGDVPTAVRVALATSIVSVFVIPLWLNLGMYLIISK